jgi:RNA polymerase sigma factor (sigma-70 family)
MTGSVEKSQVAETFCREPAAGEAGQQPTLPPASQEQLDEVMRKKPRYMREINRRINSRYAEDVWQDVQVALITDLANGKEIRHLHAYVRRVCINTTAAYLRKINRQVEQLVADPALLEVGAPPDDLLRIEDSETLRICREVLTGHEFKIYVLRFYCDLDTRTVAEQMSGKTTPHAVRQAIYAANQKLRQPEVLARLPYERHGER